MAAKYKMIIDFHGTYKPTGLQRTYPNVLNFEGVYGLEQLKWDDRPDQVTYDVTIPFVRMLAGPFDYTQGAMRNANRYNFRPVFTEPMSQGTRCRQLAEYVIFESPLNMLCDSPSNYMKEEQCTRFIAGVPTVWDETIALDGEIGKHVAIARRSGNRWYIGALTNWDARTLQVKLDFVAGANYQMALFQDGVNAHRVASDYIFKETTVAKDEVLTLNMKPGGGWAAVLIP
jgi:alpha-glucosidase